MTYASQEFIGSRIPPTPLKWRQHFALVPRLVGGRVVWLRWIARRPIAEHYLGSGGRMYEYGPFSNVLMQPQ